jgi:ADP-ribosylglycohydrolase
MLLGEVGMVRRDRFRGVFLGTAVGDALGLPTEGLSPGRANALFGSGWRHRLVLNRGMISDDTEQTIFVAQSLIAHPSDPNAFGRRLAWCLRWWLASLPAGVGFATLRAILRLCVGVPPARSGVRSAGTGAAMRVAPIGAFLSSHPAEIDPFVEAATRLTHTDPRALVAARVVARLVAWTIEEDLSSRPPIEDLEARLRSAGAGDVEWETIVSGLVRALRDDLSVEVYARSLGLEKGVTGYAYHVVPVAVFAWYRHFGRFREAVSATLSCGGDTDTAGAIAGALAGATVGVEGIPSEWVDGIADWPRGPVVAIEVADRLHEVSLDRVPKRPIPYFWPGVLPRNILFLAVVLAHGFRRLLPPYR